MKQRTKIVALGQNGAPSSDRTEVLHLDMAAGVAVEVEGPYVEPCPAERIAPRPTIEAMGNGRRGRKGSTVDTKHRADSLAGITVPAPRDERRVRARAVGRAAK